MATIVAGDVTGVPIDASEHSGPHRIWKTEDGAYAVMSLKLLRRLTVDNFDAPRLTEGPCHGAVNDVMHRLHQRAACGAHFER